MLELSLIFMVGLLTVIVASLMVSHIKLWIEFKALRNSTHQVSFVNQSGDFEKLTEDLKKHMTQQVYDNIQ